MSEKKKPKKSAKKQAPSVIRNFRITASDGKHYNAKHYNLSAIIAVGYKVNSERAVRFRKWATTIIEEFTIRGFARDDERLKGVSESFQGSEKLAPVAREIGWSHNRITVDLSQSLESIET